MSTRVSACTKTMEFGYGWSPQHPTGAPVCLPIAYADDLVVIIPGNSRRELEERVADVIRIIERSTARQKLQLSMQKTTGMILQGKLDPRRPPQVRIGEGSLRFVQHLRYLGVTLQTNLKIDMHVQQVSEKAKVLFQALARLGGRAGATQL